MARRLCIIIVAMLVIGLLPSSAFAKPAVKGMSPKAVRPLVVPKTDAYEPDDTTTTATDIDEEGYGITEHSFTFNEDNPDHDWVKFSADETGQPFILQSTFVDGYLDNWMYVYEVNPDGTLSAALDSSDDMVYFEGYGSEIFFVAPHPGEFFVDNYARDDNYGDYDLFVDSALARRVAGADRYATSVAISKTMWPDTENPDFDWGPENIIVANDQSIDALTGGSFGATWGYDWDAAPLLLTKQSYMPEIVSDEIARLAMGASIDDYRVTVWVLGGPDKVSDAVFSEIEGLPWVADVQRIAGVNRYETAAKIASVSVEAGNTDDTVFVVNGGAVADALSASPLGFQGAPMLLTTQAHLSNETSQWLADHPGFTNAVVVGGEDKVSDDVITELEGIGLSVERIAGADRYETSALLGRFGISNWSVASDGFVIASGEKFPDGLCGGPMAAMAEAPLLLTPGASLEDTITSFYEDFPTTEASYILGGYPTISEDVEMDFNSLWMED